MLGVEFWKREDFIDQMARELGMPEGERPMVVSGATGLGVRELLEACWSEVQNSKNGGLKSDSSGWGVG